MNLTESLADSTKCQLIDRLTYNPSSATFHSWKDVANTLAFTYERILQLPPASFWSSVVYNKTIMQSFDAVLEAIPRRFEIDEYRLIFCWDTSVAMAADRLYNSALAILLRVAVYNKKIDTSMTPKLYLEIVRDRDVMPARRLSSALSFFEDYGQILVEVTKKRALLDPSFSTDITKICAKLGEAVPAMENDASRLVDEFYAREGVAKLRAARLVDEWLCTALALCQEGCTILDTMFQARLLDDASKYISGIPSLIESVGKLFSTETIMDVAMTLSDYPLRRLLRLRTQVLQSGVDFYHLALVRMPSDQKIATILSILELECFVYLLNEKQNLVELVEGCQKEQKEYIERALESVCDSQRIEMVKELEKCGLLMGLGDVARLNEAARQAMEEMSQIFPHFSPQYIHLCLRHFGYDATKAIDALLARDERLPLMLRRVESSDLTARSTAPPTLPALSFQNDELLMSALQQPQRAGAPNSLDSLVQGPKEPEGKNVFKGLISLAPIAPSASSAVKNLDSTEKPVSEVMKKLREALEALKIRAAGIEDGFEPQFGVDGERLVPMPKAKKYAGIKKLKISETDKIAIRPSYEKYRYETLVDDVYDDEYDDGYEQKEFQVEPLNAQSSTDESGTEDSEVSENPSGRVPQGRASRGRGAGSTAARGAYGGNGSRNGGNEQTAAATESTTSRSNYTGGRQRQIKEQHKNAFKQRGADRKMRGAY